MSVDLEFRGQFSPFTGTHPFELQFEPVMGQRVRFHKPRSGGGGGGYYVFVLGNGFLEFQEAIKPGELPRESREWPLLHLPITEAL